jgi:predicted alpha/beta-fold hydrolase
LRRKVKAKLDLLRPHIDVSRALAAKTLTEFDDASTAPLHGFRSAEDYYDRCSSARYLGGVRVPSLLIHSLDDPFLPAESVPRRHMTGNGNFTTLLTERGGHVGFLEGSPFGPRFWGEDVGADFLAQVLAAR